MTPDLPFVANPLRAWLLGSLAALAVPAGVFLEGTAVAVDTTADTGSSCENWGTITPSTRETYFGEFMTFRIGGGPSCGDVDSCSWWTDGNTGDFLQTTGSPVTWRAPSDYGDCVTLEIRLWASCTDGSTTGYSDITVRCTHEQLSAVQDSRNAVVTGGGCGGPVPAGSGSTSTAGLLLLPLFGLLRRKHLRMKS
ncbi:MAG: hypothetical protein GXP62_02660 [Oligoflexia bacterium]|nr:hypothetical protein [Oligoflexia bacterium]